MNKKQNSKQKIQKLAENDARPERAIQPTELLNDTLRRIFGCELADATQKQVYRALCISVPRAADGEEPRLRQPLHRKGAQGSLLYVDGVPGRHQPAQ